MSEFLSGSTFQVWRINLTLTVACLCLAGCRSQNAAPKPSLEISRVPPAVAGGPERMDAIEGHVTGAKNGQQIVVYTKNEVWWVQPFANQPFAKIEGNGTWKASTHLGTDYAALLVDAGYHPDSKTASLPSIGDGVAAVVRMKGGAAVSPALKTIHFSGYDWIVRSAPSERGGEMNYYDPANAWTDEKGYLHLRMGDRDGRWTCAEINLTRSLGYGTYKIVVQDSAHLSDSAVLGIFTLNERLDEQSRPEMDIELSRWGRLDNKNAQYVVQPYYVPVNIARFVVPSGVVTHVLRWEPGSASFQSVSGASARPGSKGISQHVFTSGVPTAAEETFHIDLYDFFHSKRTSPRPAEVVIEKFEYLP